MPHLTPVTRRQLKYLHTAGQALHGAGALACWNWALNGFGPIQNNPDELFNYVSLGIPYNGANPWFTPARDAELLAFRNAWIPHENAVADTPARRGVLRQLCRDLTRLAMSFNGMTPTGGRTPYQVVMHYDPVNNNGDLNGPNYTHWWIQVDGGGAGGHNDGLEVFPGSAHLTIRRPEYDSGQNNCRVYAHDLTQDQVTRITNVLDAVIQVNHLAVPHGGWVNNFRCAICNGLTPAGIARHHCRCCGRTVCASCSPGTRLVLRNGQVALANPAGGGAGPGPHRVCLYC